MRIGSSRHGYPMLAAQSYTAADMALPILAAVPNSRSGLMTVHTPVQVAERQKVGLEA